MLVWLRSSEPFFFSRLRPRAAQSLRRGQIEVIQRIPRRMFERDIQGLEIVPLVFHLRAIDRGEPQASHQVFEFLDRLRERMQVPQPRPDSRHGGIEARTVGGRSCAGGQAGLGRFQRRLDLLLELVEALACGRLVGLIDRPEALLGTT